MIYDHFQAIGACDAAQGLSDLFNICLQSDDVQDFDTRWDQILSGTSEIPHENVLEGLCKMKLQDSEQLQTLLALCNQDLDRDKVPPSYQNLRTTVRQHIDQTIRTRNFRARNERIETGALVKESLRKKRQRCEKNWEKCCQWQATGQWSRGNACSFTHGENSGNRRDHGHGAYSGQRAQSSSCTSRTPTQTDGKKPYKYGNLRGASP